MYITYTLLKIFTGHLYFKEPHTCMDVYHEDTVDQFGDGVYGCILTIKKCVSVWSVCVCVCVTFCSFMLLSALSDSQCLPGNSKEECQLMMLSYILSSYIPAVFNLTSLNFSPQMGNTSVAMNQIELDLLRTLPTNKYYNSPDAPRVRRVNIANTRG